MSEESLKVVRQRLTPKDQTRRSLEERLYWRFPGASEHVVRAVQRLWGSLPPRSRFRRALLRRYMPLALAAGGRGDFEAASLLYHPDVEMIRPREFAGLGFEPVYRGREERVSFQVRWIAEWGQFTFEPEEVLDLGARVLVVGRVRGSGLASGAAFDEEWADLFDFSSGQVIREQAFFNHREALEAAGLRE
jgi:ketosteroid isomerase-like protein